MNYEASVRYLLSLGRELAAPTQAAAKFDLENITILADRLGRPDRAYPTAHIAGPSLAASDSSARWVSRVRRGPWRPPRFLQHSFSRCRHHRAYRFRPRKLPRPLFA